MQVAPAGAHWEESPCEFTLVHALPRVPLPPSQKPLQGLAGVPAHAAPVPPGSVRQSGQGSAGAPVKKICEVSATSALAVPATGSTTPPLGCENVLTMQVLRKPFGIGSGVPKEQPVSLQP